MALIDEKGRLFGKINIIDFLVILFLLSLTPVFYFGYRIVTKKIPGERKEYIVMTIKGKLAKLKPEVVGLISEGDREIDIEGNVICKIMNLGEIQPYSCEFEISPEKKLIHYSPNLKQAQVTLKMIGESRGKNIYYKDVPISEGDTIKLNAGKYLADVEDIVFVKDADTDVVRIEIDKYDVLKKQVNESTRNMSEKIIQLQAKINALENKSKRKH